MTERSEVDVTVACSPQSGEPVTGAPASVGVRIGPTNRWCTSDRRGPSDDADARTGAQGQRLAPALPRRDQLRLRRQAPHRLHHLGRAHRGQRHLADLPGPEPRHRLRGRCGLGVPGQRADGRQRPQRPRGQRHQPGRRQDPDPVGIQRRAPAGPGRRSARRRPDRGQGGLRQGHRGERRGRERQRRQPDVGLADHEEGHPRAHRVLHPDHDLHLDPLRVAHGRRRARWPSSTTCSSASASTRSSASR